jgi:flavin-dependent dehydrogenase
MDSCDVLIVGGGPAGSSCAWGLRDGGLDVLLVDRAHFPRVKPCAGWITPRVFDLLGVSPADYGTGRTLQPIRRFRTGTIGGDTIETDYGGIVSWGIRRPEFDRYLLSRLGCRVVEGLAVSSLEYRGGYWDCNGSVRASLVVGAGGHFCPLARRLSTVPPSESVIVTAETEIRLEGSSEARCPVEPDCPELYFCRDMRGYGWCFRKGPFLSVGLGRLDSRSLSGHVGEFLAWLKKQERVPRDLPEHLRGHAYCLRGSSQRALAGDRCLLVGDSAGLAVPRSGEGIRPAIESGLLAAKVILACGRNYGAESLREYPRLLSERFGPLHSDRASSTLPGPVGAALGRAILSSAFLVRRLVLNRWFLDHGGPSSSSFTRSRWRSAK